jgi:predicted dehydrogenase
MRIVQVGIGGWGRGWAELVQTTPGVELAAVVDPNPTAQLHACEVLGLPTKLCYQSVEDALTNVPCETVLVVSPPHTHFQIAKLALEAEKHVLLEKPLATTLADAQALVEIAAQRQRILMISQNYRFRPQARAIQQLIAQGALGELISVKVNCQRDTRMTWPHDDLRYQMQYPYVLDMAIHHFDLLRALTGQNVHQIYGRGWREPNSPFQHQPAVLAVMELDNGATVLYEGSWATFNVETSWNGDWELRGTKGRLCWTGGEQDPLTGEVTLELWGQTPQRVQQPNLPLIDRASTLQAMRDAVESGVQPETAAADNIKSLAIVFACIQSIESGAPVVIAD